MNPEDPILRLQYYKETGQTEEATKYEQYLKETNQLNAQSPHVPTKLEIAKRNASMPHPEDLEDGDPSYAQQALGGIASLARDIPGAEALQAGARTLRTPGGSANLATSEGRAEFGKGYRESLSDIRKAEDSAPSVVRNANRVIGATIAGAAMPGKSIVRQGAAYGALSGLLKSDPDAGVSGRLKSAAYEGTLGALIPKAVEGIGTGVRTVAAKTLGKSALARKAAMAAMDKVNYAKAAVEGDLAAANPTPAAVTTTMNETDIKPYIAEIKASRTMQGANPAAILREAYKLMTERQKMLSSRIINSTDFKAGSELEKADIGAAKKRVIAAADQVMPSFRNAVYEHADASRNREAFRAGADATRRIVGSAQVAGKRLEQNTPEAFMESIKDMTPDEAKAALQGVLGRLRESKTLNLSPARRFGIPRFHQKFVGILPYIKALDEKAGNKFMDALGTTAVGSTALTH